jgi:hypothetical protein
MVTYFGLARMIRSATAGRFHHRGGHDDRQDDQHHVDRRRGRIDAESDDQHEEAHRAPQAESDS